MRRGTQRSAHSRRLERVSVAVLAIVWVLTPALGVLHALGGDHHYCAQHGVFEENEPASSSATPGDNQLTARGASLERCPPGDHTHEPCALSQMLRRDGCAAVRWCSPHGSIESHASPDLLRSTDARPIAILRAAPKNSPPAARA